MYLVLSSFGLHWGVLFFMWGSLINQNSSAEDESVWRCTTGDGADVEPWKHLFGCPQWTVDTTLMHLWSAWLRYWFARHQQVSTDPHVRTHADDGSWQARVEQRWRGIRAVTASLDYQDILVECGFGRIADDEWPISPDPDDHRQSKRMWEQALKQWRVAIRTLRDKHWPHASMVVAFRNLGIPIRMVDLECSGPYTVADGNSMLKAFGQSLRRWHNSEFVRGRYLMCKSSAGRLQRYTALQVGRWIVHVDGVSPLYAWDIRDGIM